MVVQRLSAGSGLREAAKVMEVTVSTSSRDSQSRVSMAKRKVKVFHKRHTSAQTLSQNGNAFWLVKCIEEA